MVRHSHSPAPAASASGSSAVSRVAFFGGSFDPPHNGHLAIARAARTALDLDRVLFAPVAAQPLKPHGSSASFADRVAMTRFAIAGEPAFELSLLDAPVADAPPADAPAADAPPDDAPAAPIHTPNQSPNYTLETLQRLRAQLPASAQLFCLIGADSFLTLRRWHRAAEVPFAATLVVASRPGRSLEDLAAAMPEGLTLKPEPAADHPGPIELRAFALRSAEGRAATLYLLPGLHFDLSATQIRRALGTGSSTSAELLPLAVSQYIARHGLYC